MPVALFYLLVGPKTRHCEASRRPTTASQAETQYQVYAIYILATYVYWQSGG
jgi:hypothetical protein